MGPERCTDPDVSDQNMPLTEFFAHKAKANKPSAICDNIYPGSLFVCLSVTPSNCLHGDFVLSYIILFVGECDKEMKHTLQKTGIVRHLLVRTNGCTMQLFIGDHRAFLNTDTYNVPAMSSVYKHHPYMQDYIPTHPTTQ